MTAPAGGGEPTGWLQTTSLAAGVVLGLALLITGLVAGRADIAVLGAPALLSAAWAWTARPRGGAVTATFVPAEAGGTGPGGLRARLRLDAPDGAAPVRLRVTSPGNDDADVTVLVDGTRTLDLTTHSARTGPHRTFRVDHVSAGVEGGFESRPDDVQAPGILVLPTAQPLGRLPLPHQLVGLTGPHTTRRLGDGTELRDVHPFAPGDRLRRIDWRATARRSPGLETLYVRRTQATAEATVVLVLDSRDEVGPDVTTWRGNGPLPMDRATSLDVARNAAASVAQAALDGGDRVGFEDLGWVRRPLPPAAGKRQLRRIVHALALAHPVGDPGRRMRPPQIPAGALVYMFSTFLDDESASIAQTWRGTGHPVVAVDILPTVEVPRGDPGVALAWRITHIEREQRLESLRREGILVVRWLPPIGGDDPGTPGRSARSARTALELAARQQRHVTQGTSR
ncbi:DUF58 domain-containing protein [Oerskovia enterophila]|uniref:DUF58 domain-containing protein n=1 Tax=Oerskovia enterophila TaxID=43678 RepID=UPI00339678F8